MASQDRDDAGRFGEKISDQDILKAFDYETTADDPYLTVREVTDALAEHWEIDVTSEAVRTRLDGMGNRETVAKREFGPAVAYRALVGPRLAPDVADAADELRDADRNEYERLEDL